jgi:hippurate hydrolase
MKNALCLATLIALAGNAAAADDLSPLVAAQLPGLVDTYKSLHRNPELSHHEEHTSALFAAELRKAGYRVTERVGRYPDGASAYGVVAILENGPGPRLLLRTDLDALPVVEETGVDYASHVRVKNDAGVEVGVMHACGHDVHATTMIGAARLLAALRAKWHGTLMIIGQPSEETGDGAKAMLADDLYARFGTPELAVMLHDGLEPAGKVGIVSGAALAGVTSVDVVLRGVGGHGARPQDGIDPIVMAGEFIVQLQTIVSRRQDPRDPAVVTIGSIHGGTKRNIIPNEVKLELTTRAFSDKARAIILDGIRRTADGVALAAGVPPDRAPIVTVVESEVGPVTYNDPALTARVKAALVGGIGAENVIDEQPIMVSEDFGYFGLEGRKIPTVMFWLGAMEPAKVAAAQASGVALPGHHTSRFQPLPEPTLRTGVTAMTAVAIALLQR